MASWFQRLLPQLRWGAGPKGIPFHDYFLDRVIRVPAVQRWRDSVTESWEEVGPFFDEGRLPGDIVTYAWPIDKDPAPFTPAVKGTYDLRETYSQLDIVACDGAALIASATTRGSAPARAGS